jgi:hypothetical protein
MEDRLFHVFRNTPFGRETFLQSLYFCKTIGVGLHVYIPESTQFLMYFDHDAVQVDLDGSYLTSPQSARSHVDELAESFGVKPVYFVPKNFTASRLPDVPTAFNYMCCPRSISDISSKIGLGYIGPKVRRILKSSFFPVLLSGSAFKPWKSIMVFYGGSHNANKALRWGLHLSQKAACPLDMITYTKHHEADFFSQRLQEMGLLTSVEQHVRNWHQTADGSFEESLYVVPHDALLIVGAYGHGLLKDFVAGSKMESIQSWMPNNILLIGPHCALGAA